MTSIALRAPPPPAPGRHVGEHLRYWRAARRMSQLDLAIRADTSSRHLSFVETGRAQPSREMVTRLADALEIPLRERNAVLIAAGYAPLFRETELSAPDMQLARQAVEFILKQQEPYPAIVVDRRWQLVRVNQGATNLLGFLLGDARPEPNVLRLVLRPDGLRPFMANWEEVASNMIRRIRQELTWAPADETAHALLAESLAYPGVPTRWQTPEVDPVPAAPMFMVTFRKDGEELRFFTTYTTFGTPLDITLAELRIESFFPADDATAAACRELAVKRAL